MDHQPPIGVPAEVPREPSPIPHAPRMLDLRTVTTPVLAHLLEGEVRFPRPFLLRCRRTLRHFTLQIPERFPPELVELAALPLWVYINLRHRLGQPKAYEMMRVVLLTGGVAQWNLAYATVTKPRTFANLCDQELEVNRSGPTRWNTLHVVERTDRRFELVVTRCLYHELTTAMGVPEVTPVICQIDNAAVGAYLPDQVVFQRGGPGNRIADGAPACRFVWDVQEDHHGE